MLTCWMISALIVPTIATMANNVVKILVLIRITLIPCRAQLLIKIDYSFLLFMNKTTAATMEIMPIAPNITVAFCCAIDPGPLLATAIKIATIPKRSALTM